MDTETRLAKTEADVETLKQQHSRMEHVIELLRQESTRQFAEQRDHIDSSIKELREQMERGFSEQREHTDRSIKDLREQMERGFSEQRASQEQMRRDINRSLFCLIGFMSTGFIAIGGVLMRISGQL